MTLNRSAVVAGAAAVMAVTLAGVGLFVALGDSHEDRATTATRQQTLSPKGGSSSTS